MGYVVSRLVFTFWKIFAEYSSFLKNYPAKSEVKGITERKSLLCESYLRKWLCPVVLKKNMASENVQFFFEILPVFGKLFFFFSKTNLLIPRLIAH